MKEPQREKAAIISYVYFRRASNFAHETSPIYYDRDMSHSGRV